MEPTKIFMRAGEKARLEIVLMIAVVMSSIKWTTQSGCVALDRSEQKSPLDMAIIATGQQGIAYVEFEAEVPYQNRKITHAFEIHNIVGETNDEFNAYARIRRSYRRKDEQSGDEQGKAETQPTGTTQLTETSGSMNGVQASSARANKTDAEKETSMMRMNSDNRLMKDGAPAKPAEQPVQTIEPLPINDTTTTSLGGTIGSSAFASGAKPTGTVVGIDTIHSDMNIETPVDSAPEENKSPEQLTKEEADQKELDESIQKAAEIDEHLKEEAKKLPSETELSGEPVDVVIRPTDTVDADDSRREANKDQAGEVRHEVEEKPTETEQAPVESEKEAAKSTEEKEVKESEAKPKTATKKAAKPTPKAEKTSKK